jgi:hypothetical protein
MNSTDQNNDLVVFDVLNGGNQPFHMFTKEAFADLKKIISNDALVLINFQGYLKGQHGMAARSIYKTLSAAGFKTKYYHKVSETQDGNIHYISSLSNLNNLSIHLDGINECCKIMEFTEKDLFENEPLSVDDGLVLRVDLPQLEFMGNYWNEQYRKIRLEKFLKPYSDNSIPFFNK